MTEEEYRAVVVTPEAWGELYALLQPLILNLSKWGMKHDQPVPVVIGAAWGVAQIIAEIGDYCDCPLCEATAEAISDELVARMLEAVQAVKH